VAEITSRPAPRPRRLQRRIQREAWLAGLLILGALWMAKQTAAVAPGVGSLALTLAVAAQLYGPMLRVGKNGVTWDSLGLRWRAPGREAAAFALAVAVTFPPYAVGFAWWQGRLGHGFEFHLPSGFLVEFFTQTLVLALAEEVFFRGYLQERFDRGWPPQLRLLGVRVGWGLILTAVFFALAHVVGEWNPARLGPFFPGLVFGWLRARTGSVVAATAYHAVCNGLADVMFASYR
jgi:membrane protease YdiL (CAAX protease family)